MGMRAKNLKSRSLKKAMAPTLALLACMSLGFVVPEMASAQDIGVYGGGGGGAGTGNATDDTTSGSTGIMNGGAGGGGAAETGGAGGDYFGSGAAGTAGGVDGTSGSVAATPGGTAAAGTGATDTNTPANTGAGGGGGGGDGAAVGAGIADNSSTAAGNGTNGADTGVGGNGGSGANMNYDLDVTTNGSVGNITIGGGQAGQDGSGGATGGTGGSATLNGTNGAALTVNGNISVNTQAAQTGATQANGTGTLNLANQDVNMLSGAVNIKAGAANASASMKSLTGNGTTAITVDSATVAGTGTASLTVTSDVTGAGAVAVNADSGNSNFSVKNLTNTGNISVTTAVGTGTAAFSATGAVNTTGNIDVTSNGATAGFSAAGVATGGNITVTSGAGTGTAGFTSTGAVVAGGDISVITGAGANASFTATGQDVTLGAGKTLAIDSTNGNTAAFNAKTLKTTGASTVNIDSTNTANFNIGTGISVGDGKGASTLTFNGISSNNWTNKSLELNQGTLDMSAYTGTYGTNYSFSTINATGKNVLTGTGAAANSFNNVDFNFDLTGLKNGETVLTVEAGTITSGYTGAVTITQTPDGRVLGTAMTGAAQDTIMLLANDNSSAIDGTGLKAHYSGSQDLMVQYYAGTFYGYDVKGDATGFYLKSNGAGADIFDLYSDAGAAQILTLSQAGQLTIDSVGRIAHRNETGLKLDLNIAGFSYDNSVGSKVEVDGFGAVLGLGYTFEGSASKFTLGGFLEAGNGSYDAYNHSAYLGKLKGDGETKYFGGGLFAHNIWENGFYLEGSFRLGSADHDFSYDDFSTAKYNDKSSNYYGAHAGLGYKFAPCWENGEFDVYGKFAWTHMDGYSFRNSQVEKMVMDDIDSYRTRLGARYTHTYDNGAELYVGAAWDHEFDGEAKGKYQGVRILNTAKTEGSSAFFETGFRINPIDTPMSIDVGLFGSAGQNEGFGGTVGLKWEF